MKDRQQSRSVGLEDPDIGKTVEFEKKLRLAHIKGFPYYGYMNVTLSLDDKLVKQARKIAVEMDTTLTGLIRSNLEQLVNEHAASGSKRREHEALEQTFKKYQFRSPERRWTREELYERR